MSIIITVTLSVHPRFTASTAILLHASSCLTSRKVRGRVDSKLVSASVATHNRVVDTDTLHIVTPKSMQM